MITRYQWSSFEYRYPFVTHLCRIFLGQTSRAGDARDAGSMIWRIQSVPKLSGTAGGSRWHFPIWTNGFYHWDFNGISHCHWLMSNGWVLCKFKHQTFTGFDLIRIFRKWSKRHEMPSDVLESGIIVMAWSTLNVLRHSWLRPAQVFRNAFLRNWIAWAQNVMGWALIPRSTPIACHGSRSWMVMDQLLPPLKQNLLAQLPHGFHMISQFSWAQE